MVENSIVEIRGDDLVVGTWDLAKGLGVEHRALKNLVKKYSSEFETFGVVTSRMQQPNGKNGGRKVNEFLLNEPHATYLVTLLTNNEKVRQFKMKLTKQFFIQRKLLMHIATTRQNEEWLQKREAGKLERRLETDAIKEFVEYAKNQGSKSASKYYMAITKMENQSLVNLELLQQNFDNIRNVIDLFSLSALQIADVMVATSIREGMKKKMYYKDIYISARDKVEQLAISIGKTPLRLMKENNMQLN